MSNTNLSDNGAASTNDSTGKRRSRWGEEGTEEAGQEAPRQRKRRSRWGNEKERVELPAHVAAATKGMSAHQREQYLRKFERARSVKRSN